MKMSSIRLGQLLGEHVAAVNHQLARLRRDEITKDAAAAKVKDIVDEFRAVLHEQLKDQ